MDKKIKNSVLVVDDDKASIITLTHILSPEYTIYAAKNGRESIELAINFLPDVILLDIMMPDMDGFELLSILKNTEETKNIPVIFITALDKAGEEEKGLALGAVDYIIKPFFATVVKLRIGNQIKILEQKKTEKALWEADAASKAKSEFLSKMSHEMRTPMNAIIGLSTIGIRSEHLEQKNQALKKISDASYHLLGIINDVLDMAKIEANKMELALVEYNFEHMIQKVLSVINFRADEKRQQLTVNIDKNIPAFLVGDDKRLAQVIANLLYNAVKFTPEEGKILLEASLEPSLENETENCILRIEVSDDGIGISKEEQKKIFNVFVQADSGLNREYGGTGLGLVVSKNIIELMGGRIWVESELGKGARFIFTVKMQCSKNKRSSHTDSGEIITDTEGEFNGKKLLAADDIEINLEILRALLEGTGLLIDCAESGKEALEMVTKDPEKYDMVFMDMQMPKMDGLEATRRIRELPSLQNRKLPIIAMTANIVKSDIETCYKAGMDGHIGKPLDIDIVFETLRKYLT